MRTMDVYNPFVAELMVDGTFSTVEPYLDQVNEHIAASARANGIPMAQAHLASMVLMAIRIRWRRD